MITATLTKEQRAEIRTALKDAIFHLCSCWDALREAEEVFQESGITEGDFSIEVETEDIELLAGDCCPAENVYEIKAEDLNALIDAKLVEYGG